MSLIVTTFHIDEAGNYIDDPYPEKPGQDLAGPEVWRDLVWGSFAARKLGAKFLPTLADGQLYVETKDLKAFAGECNILLENLEEFAREVGYTSESINQRLQNFLAAISRANPINGGIQIG